MNRSAKASRHSRRKLVPRVLRLEARELLSLSGTWLGQDGHDLVGRSPVAGADGFQDVHIALSSLSPSQAVEFIDLSGLGGGNWQYGGAWGPWRAEFVRASGATVGDLFFAPGAVETGRPFQVIVRYADGTSESAWVTGGAADPNLPNQATSVSAAWLNQDGADLTGPSAAVGPDGRQDAHLVLGQLTASSGIEEVEIRADEGRTWRSGLNLGGAANAEVVRRANDPSQADLYFQPISAIVGRVLDISIRRTDGGVDRASLVAGSFDPERLVPTGEPLPTFRAGMTATWVGQDGGTLAGPGSVRVGIDGLPSGRLVNAAILTNETGATWVYRRTTNIGLNVDPFAKPLVWSAQSDPGRAELAFAPVRDEAGAVLSLRVLFDDGTMALASVLGGFANPNLRVNRPAASSVLARPGDDLHSLVGQFGTVRLAPGTYRLDRPLVLERAVSLVSESAGPVTLLFEQPASSAPWTAAIKIHAGATTLRGFSIRFAGPVRWDWSVSYGPAVIGTTDDRDPTSGSLKADVRFESLDLESPPAGSAWEEAPRSIRLASAENGVLVNNIIRGGTTEFFRGPWQIEGNDYRGTVPGTYAWSAFAGHDTHDLLLRNNHAEPRGNSGKTWRFLVMTVSGTHDRIIGNTVVGIGPKDSDTIRENAAEIVLTEAYRLRFEGKPLVISGDGRGVRIPTPQGTPVKIGDVLAVVEGSGVGDYARVTQLLDATTLVLDRPIDPYASAVTIAPAFVDYRFEQNVIDSRGSSAAGNLVLVGNHYGSHVQNNTFLGGDGVKITAAPTELPVAWGWSRAPMLELTFADNRIEDARRGGFVAVEHGRPMKSTVGRLYMTARIERNLVRWSQGFRGESDLGLVIGDRDALDPGGFRLELAENSAIWSGPAQPRIKIESAVVNGQILIEQVLLLPPATGFPTPSPGAGSAPGNLMLVNDTGSSASDRVTSDPRLAFDPVPGASGYEYRVGDGVYRSVPNPIAFAPTEISEGPNRVSIRARTATGAVSADSVIDFVLDRLPPAAPLGGRGFADGTIALPALEPGASVEYRLGANAPYTSVGAVASFRPEGLGIGRSSVRVRQVDAAGHSSPEVLIPIRVRRTFARGIWRGQTNVDRVGASSALGPNGVRDVWIRLANLPTDVVVSSVAVEGLGGDSWGWNASPGSWRAALVRRGLARSADLYIHPARNEIGRPFLVTLGYADGTYERFWMAGGRANPSARIALRRVGRRSR